MCMSVEDAMYEMDITCLISTEPNLPLFSKFWQLLFHLTIFDLSYSKKQNFSLKIIITKLMFSRPDDIQKSTIYTSIGLADSD